MNETSQDSTANFGFEQRLLGELRLLVSDGALRRRDKKRRQPRFTRRPAFAVLAALLLLIVIGGTVSIAAGRLPFVDREKSDIVNRLAHRQHIGPEVASVGPWKLFAAPSTHPGWINLEIWSADEQAIGGIKANNPLAVSEASGSSTALLYGHVDPDRVAMLKLKIGDSERRVLLSSSGYFIESLALEPSDVSTIAQGNARLVALSENGDVVRTYQLSGP